MIFLLLAIISFPILEGFGQIQTEKGEGVFFVNMHPYSFKDESGYTVILGEISNNRDFPISKVRILASFYNDISDEPIDSVIGYTIFNSIPPQENAPFILKSSMPDSSISRIGVTLLGFDSSPEIQTSLLIQIDSLEISNSLDLSGKLTNIGNNDARNIKIYLMSFDVFQPPRIVNISSITLDNPISSGISQNFSINGTLNPRSVDYYVVAQSDNYLSNIEIINEEKIISQNKIITINEVKVTNIKQENSIIFSPVRIEAEISMQEFTSMSVQEPYTLYVQIKNAESGLVEFISSKNATLSENLPEKPNIVWIPEKEGLFFIETYLWNDDNIVLSPPGEILLIHVNAA